jgi:TetR/AcrR family transcriptional regulator, cholesterol catabolism regulator
MKEVMEQNEARERVLAAAEELFADKGYGPVTLRDIGARAGIHHSSVYHHVPGGKEALFVEVTERVMHRHGAALSHAIDGTEQEIRQQLYAVADYLLDQPPMDLLRMEHVDMPALKPSNAERLSEAAYKGLMVPLETALTAAERRGEIAHDDWSLLSGGLLGMIESLHAVSPQVAGKPRRVMAHRLIDVMLDGLRPRSAS